MTGDRKMEGLAAAVDRFNTHYVYVVDNEVSSWPECFAEDGGYHVMTKDSASEDLPAGFLFFERKPQLIDRINALLNASIYPKANLRHLIGACKIHEATGDRIKATAPFVVYESREQEVPSVYATGQYEDEFIRNEGGELLLLSRRCVLDNDIVRTMMALPL